MAPFWNGCLSWNLRQSNGLFNHLFPTLHRRGWAWHEGWAEVRSRGQLKLCFPLSQATWLWLQKSIVHWESLSYDLTGWHLWHGTSVTLFVLIAWLSSLPLAAGWVIYSTLPKMSWDVVSFFFFIAKQSHIQECFLRYKYCSSTIYRLMLQVAILLALWKLSIYLLGWDGRSQLL